MSKLFIDKKIYLLISFCFLINTALQAQLKAVFSLDTTGGCAPFTLGVKEKSTGNPTQYFWDFGNGQTSSARTPVITYITPGIYTLTETVTSGSEQNSAFTTIYVRGVPATFTYTYNDICTTPAAFRFAADSVDNTVKYHWNFGDNNKSIQDSPDYTYNTGGKYTVQLITTSVQGCADTSLQKIQVGKGDADFLLPAIACADEPLQLTNSSLPMPKTTIWSLDNTTLTGTDIAYTFSKTGTFNIRMNADFGTCEQSVTKQVTVLSSPKAIFSQSGTLIRCTYPTTVEFANGSINASSYKWVFGDGATATTRDATHTYLTAGIFNVSLVAYNANGCTDTLTKKALVQLGPPVVNGFNNLPVSGCIPVTAKPTANITSPENITSYDWDFGDGTHEYIAAPTHKYTAAGYYRVTLTVKTTSGCTGTYSMFQAVAGGAFPPTADFSVPNTDVCGASPVQFTASVSAGTVTSWNWDFGDGTKSNIQNPIHQYSALGNYSVILYVSDKGCPSQNGKSNYISVKPPIAKIQPVYYCDDRLKVDFKDQSIKPLTWHWDFGDGESSNNQNETHVYDKAGQYHVTLATTNNGCSSTADTLITLIDNKPKITISLAGSAVCRKDSITLNVDNTDYINDYLWNLADGTTIFSNSNLKYAYQKSGTFAPYLVVNYVNGCKDTSTLDQTIQVYGPTAHFSALANACLHQTVAFADASRTDGIHDITAWQWNDGAGGITQQTTPAFSHTYTIGSTYTPILKVTDAFGCSDSIAAATPIVVNGVAAAFDYTTNNANCAAALYTFTNQSAAGNDAIARYKWSFGDGDSAFVENPQHNYTQSVKAGQATLTVVSAGGCADTATKSITVDIAGVPQVVADIPKNACLQTPVQFTATQSGSTNATNWLWDFGNGATSTGQNTTYTYNAPAVYSVQLIASNNANCADTVTQIIIVHTLPDVNVTEDLLVCAGKTVSLTASGAETYTWQPIATLGCLNCAAPIASPVVTTMYYVQGTDQNGCANTDSVLVTVQQQNELFVAKNAISLCTGDSVMLAASGADIYNWEPAAGLSNIAIANPLAKPSATMDYTVTGTDNAHCFTTSAQVKIVVVNKPVFNITDTLLTLNKGATQQVQTSSSADVVNWLWQPHQGLNCYNCATPVVTADQSLTYTAIATNSTGCSAADMIRIAVLCDNARLYVPTAFTPNNDGKNDRFIPLSVSGSFQKIKAFDIFNSTGQKVFSKQNIVTNSYADGWDGTYKGNLLGGAVFIYKIEIECNGKIIPLTGTVTVIR